MKDVNAIETFEARWFFSHLGLKEEPLRIRLRQGIRQGSLRILQDINLFPLSRHHAVIHQLSLKYCSFIIITIMIVIRIKKIIMYIRNNI